MNPVPKHIAIIMDGNGRWAKQHGLPREEGHRKGVETVEAIVEACQERGVKHLTLYAFSEENWNRPDGEVASLMKLLSFFLTAKCQKMLDNGIRFRTIGDIEKLPADVLEQIQAVKEKTSDGQKMELVLALSYGSHSELTRTINTLIAKGKPEVTVQDVEDHLDTRGMPNPDLLIRTSGEYRLSNFLLWQLAYSELYFTDVLWPEFSEAELDRAISDFQGRERRFGGVGEDD